MSVRLANPANSRGEFGAFSRYKNNGCMADAWRSVHLGDPALREMVLCPVCSGPPLSLSAIIDWVGEHLLDLPGSSTSVHPATRGTADFNQSASPS